MKIGNLKLENGFFLAPMANFSTPPFRKLCKEEGAGLTTSEMVACDAVLHGFKRISKIIERSDLEVPYAIQIFGADSKNISHAAQALEKKCEILDLNFGCPSHIITNQGAGAALLKKPALIKEILDSLSTLTIPVTAKMRLGFNTKTKCVEIAKLIEKGGAAALTVHGRTYTQDYSTKPDLISIKKIKEALSIPVIGNGNIYSPEDAENMLKKTGCDGVMIGRGAQGNPFIFRQMLEYFETGQYEIPREKERMEMFLKFLEYSKNEEVPSLRTQVVFFTKGLKGASRMRQSLTNAKSVEEMKKIAQAVLSQS
jgi:tRNA-dihydrouridine synthase B